MKLELKPESWKNLFDSIRQSEIKAVSNFWASIQSLEEQYGNEMKEVIVIPKFITGTNEVLQYQLKKEKEL
jgi:hypothetical protein